MRDRTVIWCTDGSKTASSVNAELYGRMTRNDEEVFQAEVHAIRLCVEENFRMGLTGRNICIFSDRQAALKSLWSPKVTSKMVWECLQTLNEQGTTNRTVLGTRT